MSLTHAYDILERKGGEGQVMYRSFSELYFVML
jgi:hypothetical protein